LLCRKTVTAIMTCHRGGFYEKTINWLLYYSNRLKNLQKDNNKQTVYAAHCHHWHSKTGTKMAKNMKNRLITIGIWCRGITRSTKKQQ